MLQIFPLDATFDTGIAKRILKRYLREPFFEDAENVCEYLDRFTDNCCTLSTGGNPILDVDDDSTKENALDECLERGLELASKSLAGRVLIVIGSLATILANIILIFFYSLEVKESTEE